MTYSDDLFQLIRSMTKAEKRYFKLVATRYKQQKVYLQLFDALNRQEVYNEELLRERFCEEVYAGQFHVAKNYLYKMILKSLRNFSRSKSKEAKVEELIVDIKLLYDRGLFKQARKLWNQANRYIQTLENPHLKLKVVELRILLSGKASQRMESLDDVHDEQMLALRELEQIYEYSYLHERIGNLCTTSPRRSPELKAELARLVANPLLSHTPVNASWRILNSYYWSHATYHYALSEYPRAIEMMLQSKQLYDELPDRRGDFFSEYIMLIGNLLTLMKQTNETKGYTKLIEGLRSTASGELTKNTGVANRSYSIYMETVYLAELQMETWRGNFERCLSLIPEITHFLNNTASYRCGIQRNTIRLLIAYSYFACGQVTQALNCVNIMLRDGEPSKGRSVYYTTRELELMIHYELGNFDLLESLERSLRARLSSQQLTGTYEAQILRFFRAVLTGSEVDWNPDSYQPTEPHVVFAYIDFPAWIEGKRSGEDFRHIVQCRFRQEHGEKNFA